MKSKQPIIHSKIVIGFSERTLPLDQVPGQTLLGGQSFGFASNGGLYNRSVRLFQLNEYRVGDIIGMGINFIKNELFFTHNGAFYTKVVQLKNIMEYYPSISINSMFTCVEANFGRKPFAFDLEGFVQHELSIVLSHIVNTEVDKKAILLMIQEYMHKHALKKTYDSLNKHYGLKPIDSDLYSPLLKLKDRKVGKEKDNGEKELDGMEDDVIVMNPLKCKLGSPPVKYNQHVKQKNKLTLRSSLFDTNTQVDSSYGHSSVPPCSTPREKHTKGISDRSFFPQRCLIRGLFCSGNFSAAKKILRLFFPTVCDNINVESLFIGHEFISIFRKNRIEAVIYAKKHFTDRIRNAPFYRMTLDNTIECIELKDLLSMFGLKEGVDLNESNLSYLLSKCQSKIACDMINYIVHGMII